jgi:hypothetical protein
MNGRQIRKKNDTRFLSQLEEEMKGSERFEHDMISDDFDAAAARRGLTP